MIYDKATGSAALFINGVVAGSAALGSYTPNTSTMMHIGGRNIGSFGDALFTFNGAIDEVQLYDRALSLAEIAQLYNATGTMCVAPATQYVVQTFPAGGGVPPTAGCASRSTARPRPTRPWPRAGGRSR